MTRATKRGSYAVGKGKPPAHTQFRKGQSGNPGGRPRGVTPGRAQTLALEEAYRVIAVKDGKDMVALPALQAILRSQIALAAKGNGPAQRAVIAMVQALEDGIEAKTLEAKTLEAKTAMEAAVPIPQFDNYTDAARRVAFLLQLADREQLAKEGSTPSSVSGGKFTTWTELAGGQFDRSYLEHGGGAPNALPTDAATSPSPHVGPAEGEGRGGGS
jgi:Family of unknown function (DUF5681)